MIDLHLKGEPPAINIVITDGNHQNALDIFSVPLYFAVEFADRNQLDCRSMANRMSTEIASNEQSFDT